MKNIYSAFHFSFFFLLLLFTGNSLLAQRPTITSFSPASQMVGDTVTINGTNFSTILSKNVVYFGGARATVDNATTTQLDVIVPAGATSVAPITVVNINTGLQASSLSATGSPYFTLIYSTPIATIDNTSFNTTSEPASGPGQAVAVGDFNNDRRPDIVVGVDDASGSDNITILINNGAGFDTPVNYGNTDAVLIHDVVVGDIDNDGDLDIVAVSTNTNNQVHVLKNDGSGIFDTTNSFPITGNTAPNEIHLADFNNDGYLDIITNGDQARGYILLNDQTGAFGSSVQIDNPQGSLGLGIGDFDKNSTIDFVSSSTGRVYHFLGNGDGTFTADVNNPYSGGIGTPSKITTGLFNGGTDLDLTINDFGGTNFALLNNTMSPAFSVPSTVTASNTKGRNVTVDLNGDGKHDVLSYYDDGIGNEYAQFFQGDGTGFESPVIFASTPSASSSSTANFAAADFNGDGFVDFVASSRGNEVFVNYYNSSIFISTPTGGAWNNPTTWVGGVVPTASSDVIIATTGINSVLVINNNLTINSIQVNEGAILDFNASTGHTINELTTNGIAGTRTIRFAQGNLPSISTNTFMDNSEAVVQFKGTGYTIPIDFSGKNYQNVLITGTGTKTLAAGTTIINQNLDVKGGTLQLGANSITVGGTTTISAGATIDDNANGGINTFNEISNDGAFTTSGTAGNREYRFNGNITNNATFALTAGSPQCQFNNPLGITITNNEPLNGNMRFATSASTGSCAINANVTIGAGSSTGNVVLSGGVAVASGRTLTNDYANGELWMSTLSGLGSLQNNQTINYLSATSPSITTFNNTTGSTFMYGADADIRALAPTTYHNLELSGPADTNTLLEAIIVNGDLTIGANKTLDVSTSNYTIDLKGNWINNGTFSQQNGTVTFSSTSTLQTITGATTFHDLVINNPSNVALVNSITVSNQLTLTDGKIVLGANNLTYQGSEPNLSSSTTSWIETNGTGRFIRTGTATTSNNFPVGDATAKRNLALSTFVPPTFVKFTTAINPAITGTNSAAGMWYVRDQGASPIITLQNVGGASDGNSKIHSSVSPNPWGLESSSEAAGNYTTIATYTLTAGVDHYFTVFTPLAPSSNPFITTWVTTDGTITIPTTGGGYNYDITWTNLTNAGLGDGSTTGQTGIHTITGLTNGDTYEIAITGDFPRIFFNNGGDKLKLRTIEQWGGIAWTNMQGAFYGCSNLTTIAAGTTNVPNLSNVNSLENMFRGCLNFEGHANMNNWNVGNITNMYGMFLHAEKFNQDISNWNVGNVTNMEDMFQHAKIFNRDISSWNVDNVTNMSGMFSYAGDFNNGGGALNWTWTAPKLINTANMFSNASAFNQDISSWDVSLVTTMSGMFIGASVFDQNLGGWNVNSVTNMYDMFSNASAFNQNLGGWNVSSVTTMVDMLNGTAMNLTNYDATLTGWAAQTLTPNIQLGAQGLTYCAFAAHNTLTSAPNNWTITGDAIDVSCFPTQPVGNRGMYFDGVDDYIGISNLLNLNGNFTIEAWIKIYVPIAAGEKRYILHKNNGTQGYSFYITENSGNAQLGLGMNAGPGSVFSNSIPMTNMTNKEWHHVAVTRGLVGGAIKFYLDGNLLGNIPTNNTNIQPTTVDAYLGTNNIEYFEGQLDEVRIFNSPRSQSQIQVDMVSTTSNGAVNYWNFETGTGATAFDQSGTNNGNLTNTPLWALRVTNTDDFATPSVGSLRWAINQSNSDTGKDYIDFSIDNAGVQSIELQNISPINISQPLFIDGFSQMGSSKNTVTDLKEGSPISNATHHIIIKKGASANGNFLVTAGGNISNSKIQGLQIENFTQSAIYIQGATHNNISFTGNRFTGNNNAINLDGGGTGHTIGGVLPSERNIFETGTNAIISKNANVTIFNNTFGLDTNGNSVIGFSTSAISIFAAADNNTIGGLGLNEANLLTGSGIGIRASDAGILNLTYIGNNIYCNTTDIDFATGVNNNQPIPIITNINIASNIVTGTGVNGDIIHLYRNPSSCVATSEQEYLGTATVTTGNWTITSSFTLSAGDEIVATQTNAANGTSLFSAFIIEPEIDIQGNSISIADGDNTPDIADDTDFGTVATKTVTYTIENTGSSDLSISSVTSNLADFVVSNITFPTTITAGAITTFDVAFTPSTIGTQTATITINNNDSDEAVYNFDVTGQRLATNFFVYTDAGGSNTGINWTDAFTELESALELAISTDKIYIAAGTYKPTNQFDFDAGGGLDPRESTFQIPEGVEVYGGFEGIETDFTPTGLSARDFVDNETILSGDTDGFTDNITGTFPSLVYNDYAGNSYHVVYTKNVSAATVVDGFTLTGGNASVGTINGNGAAWYNDGSGTGNSSTPTIRNIKFLQNQATGEGGAMYNEGNSAGVSSPILINCIFSQNQAGTAGGAIYNNGNGGNSSPSFTNCTFSQNQSTVTGGAIYNDGSGGGNSNPTITNSIFWENIDMGGTSSYTNDNATPSISYSLIEETETDLTLANNNNFSDGGNNIFAQDPQFVDAATNNLAIQSGSPVINAGNNAAISQSTDIIGNIRNIGVSVDMGAYEVQTLILLGTITPTTYCAGETINVPFTTIGVFDGTNSFTAQLSDASGNFTTPEATQIGTSPINLVIPNTLTTGNNYKIRVVSSNPAINSDLSADIIVNTLPLDRTIVANPASIISGNTANIEVPNSEIGISYQLQDVTNSNADVGTPIIGTGTTIQFTTQTLTSNNDFRIIATNTTTNCNRTLNTITVIVTIPTITLGTITPTAPYCVGSSVTIPFTVSGGSFNSGNVFTVELSNDNFTNLTPITSNTISAISSNSITFNIPTNTTIGNNYKIRVTASNPNATSNESTPFAINGLPTVTLSTLGTSNCPSSDIDFIATALPSTTTYNYYFYLNNNLIVRPDPTLNTITINGLVTNDDVKVIATNPNGCSDEDNIIMNVGDSQPPTITAMQNFTRNTDATNCYYTNQTTNTTLRIPNGQANDNCGVASYRYLVSGATSANLPYLEGLRFNIGVSTITWTATDNNGNESAPNQFTVTVLDTQNPVIEAPQDITKPTDLYDCISTRDSLDIGTPVVTDNCLFRVFNDAPAQFPIGETVIIWTAIDSAGNTSTDEQIITIEEQYFVSPSDSLILVDIYNQMGGASWGNRWNLNMPIATWYGITVSCGKVASINLYNNGLSGVLPSSVLNLSRRREPNFSLNIGANRLSFESAEDFIGAISNFTYSPQSNIYSPRTEIIGQNESITFNSQTEGNFNTYQWYKDQTPINGATGWNYTISNTVPTDAGTYICEVKNTVATQLILQRNPIILEVEGFVNPTDSLALVDVFDQTGGDDWINSWDLTQPVATWEGVTVLNNKIRELDLSSNNLTGNLPDVFDADFFSELRYLSFFDNYLEGQIPASIGQITTLTYLDLDKNNFEGSVPASFGNLVNLQSLWLSRNDLTNLPDEIGNMSSLKTLYLNNNKFNSLPETIGNLSELLVLNVSDNELLNLPNSITNLSKLIEFYANRNYISTIPTNVQNLVDLRVFEINTNNLTGLPTGFLQINNLIKFRVSENKLEFDDLLPYSNQEYLLFDYAPQAPINQEENILLALNSPISFTVQTQGNGNRYQWFRDNNPVATTQNYSINRITTNDVGIYTADITNPSLPNLTLKRRSITLNVECQEGLNFEIIQPSQTIFCENQPFGLKLEIDDQFTNSEQIQWKKDGVVLAFQTQKSYTVTGKGVYTAEILTSNGCTAISNEIEITVLPQPQISIDLMNNETFTSTLNSQEPVTFQWLKDGIAIENAFDNTYKPNQTGEYSLLVLTEAGCSSVSETIIFTITGIEEPKEFRTLQLFPNPNNGNFFIDFGTNTPNGEPAFVLIDAIGRKILLKTQKISSIRYKIKTNNLTAGMYYLQIQTKDGLAFRKFIIEE